MSSKQICLVVAACNNRGIGIDGKLPWNLRGDMNFFRKTTTETQNKELKNVVIMGRKTYYSIPEKFRPLKNRINVVLSREMKEAPDGAILAKNFQDALKLTSQLPLADQIENIYIIGGSSVYQEALAHCDKIYLTQVLADFKCDTFLPEFDQSKFQLVEDPEVDSEIKTENDISYKFEVYEKMEPVCEAVPPPHFNVMAAMELNRGIGFEGGLPWPTLIRDYEYYTKLSRHVVNPEKMCVVIKGRATWADTDQREKDLGNTILISSTLKERPDKVLHIASSLDDALSYCTKEPLRKQVETIWILGGQSVYEEAVNHPMCKRIYLTRVHKEFKSDRFFVEFESSGKYKKIKDKYVTDEILEDNGIPYQFEVYERV